MTLMVEKHGVQIWNMRSSLVPSNAVNVGRSHRLMHYGNPFAHKVSSFCVVLVHSRDEACDAYETWLEGSAHQHVEPERRKWILANVHRLRGKPLVCWCVNSAKPEKRCHAFTLARMANEPQAPAVPVAPPVALTLIDDPW